MTVIMICEHCEYPHAVKGDKCPNCDRLNESSLSKFGTKLAIVFLIFCALLFAWGVITFDRSDNNNRNNENEYEVTEEEEGYEEVIETEKIINKNENSNTNYDVDTKSQIDDNENSEGMDDDYNNSHPEEIEEYQFGSSNENKEVKPENTKKNQSMNIEGAEVNITSKKLKDLTDRYDQAIARGEKKKAEKFKEKIEKEKKRLGYDQ